MSHRSDHRSRRRLRVAARLSLLGLVLALSTGCMAPKKVTTDARPLGPAPAPADGPVLVRVGLAENLAKQRVTCDGPWHLASGKLGRKVLDLTPGDTVSTWHLQGKVMYASDLQGGIMDWIILASDDHDHVLRWDDRPWRGALHFVPTPQDSVGMSLINVLELESYLAGDLNALAGQVDEQLAAITIIKENRHETATSVKTISESTEQREESNE